MCLNDPAITSFNIAQCPGLEQLLSDVYNNASDPKVTCEASCVKQLTQVRLSRHWSIMKLWNGIVCVAIYT